MSRLRREPFRDTAPDSVEVAAIRAEAKDGVLRVHLRKKAVEKPRPVEIPVGWR
jgi:HSP20 family molecular chaperone IbpA